MTLPILIILGVIGLIIFLTLASMYIYWFGTMLQTKGVPTINTFHRQYLLLKQLNIAPGSSLIDLGCGTGNALRFFSDNFSDLQLFGVDLNQLAIAWGKWINRKEQWKSIDMKYQNIFNVDIAPYDYIYIYLLPTVMPDIESYLQEHMSSHTIIISNAFALPNWKPYDHIADETGVPKIFLYTQQRKTKEKNGH